MLLSAVLMAIHCIAPDIVVADFEGADYQGWQITGKAFGTKPAQGTLPNQMVVTGFRGHGLVNSYVGGDQETGVLLSPEFKVSRRYLTFLIGGGGHVGATCMNLLVEGKSILSACGPNLQPGGNEELQPMTWDLSKVNGRKARLEIVDLATGGWGHINVDHIVLTDKAPPPPVQPRRTMIISKRYLNFPVSNTAPVRRVSLVVDGRVQTEFEIKLAQGKPDFWSFLDVAKFSGKTVELNSTSTPLSNVEQSDTIKNVLPLYREPLRPQFHFSSRRGWLNDPNGLVYYAGEYHLYYQHNPYGWDWGNMHWGHAVSKDLIHWTELPIAITPHEYGDWAYSGSSAVDWKNTGGFKSSANDVIIAAYTSTGRGECIVYSNDRGRSFTELAGNPVIKHAGRDPRLFWHEPSNQWVIAVYDESPGLPQAIAFYTSPNLHKWTFQSRIEGFFECPDIFELPVAGKHRESKWILTAANSDYMLGQFDGKVFTPETSKLAGHRGDAFYAAQTFSDCGRRVQIGWAQIATPGMPFNQMMAFPCELTLQQTVKGLRLCWNPVSEISSLYMKTSEHKNVSSPFVPKVSGELFDIDLIITPGSTKSVSVKVRGMSVTYDATSQTLRCGDRTNALPMQDGRVALRILADRTSVEIFANHGELYMPMRAQYQQDAVPIRIVSVDGNALINRITVRVLKSAWP